MKNTVKKNKIDLGKVVNTVKNIITPTKTTTVVVKTNTCNLKDTEAKCNNNTDGQNCTWLLNSCIKF